MTLFKRFSATVYSRLDQAIGQIENHDAVVDATVREVRHAAATAKVRLARVHAGRQRLGDKLQALHASDARWTERARRVGRDDEATAIACLDRRQQCRQQIANLEATLNQHEDLQRRLSADVECIEARVREISQQRDLMRARQSTAEAQRAMGALDTHGGIDLDDTFERWEVQITETELAAGSVAACDDLEREFVAAEDQDALRAELNDLLARPED